MEVSQQKEYTFDNGKISIQRHFGKETLPADVIRSSVVQAAREMELLTAHRVNGILDLSLREPQ